MARMRTIKPEAGWSESLADVDRSVRWTFAMLWTHCDDEGRAVNNPRIIKGAIYPLDDDVTADVVAAELKELERVGSVCFYQAGGKSYLHVPEFKAHQKPNHPTPSRLPPCPKQDHSLSPHVDLHEPSGSPPPLVVDVVVDVDGEGVVEGEVAESAIATQRADVERLCQHLADAITSNGSKRPTITKSWRDAARLLLDKDGRTEQQAHDAIAWCQRDEFWRANILSMPKLREKYDQLRLAATRAPNGHNGSTTNNRVAEGLALAERLERKAIG